MIRHNDCEHLSRAQRSIIRQSSRTNTALAALYGVSVRTIVRVRASADTEHPARIAAVVRKVLAEDSR